MIQPQEDHSPLELALMERAKSRRTWTFECDKFLAKGKGNFGQFRMRVATVQEQNLALIGAVRYCKEIAKDTGLENDPDLLTNAKTCWILHRVTLRPDKDLPAFHAPQFMLENLSTDELTVLLNFYQECLRVAGPLDIQLDPAKAEGIASILAHGNSQDAMDELTRFTSSQLGLLCVMMAINNETLKSEIAALKAPSPGVVEVDSQG